MFKEQMNKQSRGANLRESPTSTDDGQQPTFPEKPGREKRLSQEDVNKDKGGASSSTEKDEDIFMKAVDIAVTAERARLKYEEVKKKVRFIEDLAKRAKEESHSLQEVAASLASTATAVATVALQVCSYGSYNEAFASKIGYSKKMDLDTFMGIVSSPNSSRESGLNLGLEEEQESFYADYRTGYARQRRHSMDDHLYLTQSPEKLPLGRLKTLKSPINLPLQAPRAHPPPPPGYLQKRRRSGSNEDLEVPSSPSAEKFVEKFPRQLLPDEYKETLETPFNQIESESSMAPLWEDRYVSTEQGGKGKVGVAGAANPTIPPTLVEPSWTEKKSMKQFQMKIEHARPESSDLDMGVGPRPTTPTPPPDGSDEDQDTSEVKESSSTYISHYDVDYDAEVANLLGPKELNRLRDTEHCQGSLLRPPPAHRSEQHQRSISPLLNEEEKNKCAVIRENGTISPKQEKHTFKLAQARQEKKE